MAKPVGKFRFTLPVWGATVAGEATVDLDSRSPCSEQPRRFSTGTLPADLDSRPPCGERLLKKRAASAVAATFRFPLPIRGAMHNAQAIERPPLDLDSRSPCGEQRWMPKRISRSNNLDSRSLYRERRFLDLTSRQFLFGFTFPVWGATQDAYDRLVQFEFGFTFPVWGATAILHSPFPAQTRNT